MHQILMLYILVSAKVIKIENQPSNSFGLLKMKRGVWTQGANEFGVGFTAESNFGLNY